MHGIVRQITPRLCRGVAGNAPWSLDIFAAETNVKPEVDARIAAQRLNRLAQVLQPWVDVKKGLALRGDRCSGM
jgi:hypothetical protein